MGGLDLNLQKHTVKENIDAFRVLGTNPHDLSTEVKLFNDHGNANLLGVANIDVVRVTENVLELSDVQVGKVVHAVVADNASPGLVPGSSFPW